MALLAVSAIGCWAGFSGLQARIAALRAQVGRLETEWATISTYSQEAQSVLPQLDLALNKPQRIVEEIAAKGWTPALRGIVGSTGPDIELRDIRARRVSKEPKACVLAVEGMSTGSTPRMSADRFRQTLQRELERQFPGTVTIRFERLEDEPPSPLSPSDQQRATFEITATIGLSAKPKPLEGI